MFVTECPLCCQTRQSLNRRHYFFAH